MTKKKNEITIRSSAAEYLTYVASVGEQQDSIEMRYERAVQFRKWVNQIAKDYTIKGWVMDDERLKNGGSVLTTEYFDRLLEQIREIREYYGAAEPPVRCGESHLSGLTEPPHFFIKLLCHCWIQSIYFSHREVFSWVNTFNIDLIGIIRYAIHDGIGKSTFTITDLLVPFTFTELRTKDR